MSKAGYGLDGFPSLVPAAVKNVPFYAYIILFVSITLSCNYNTSNSNLRSGILYGGRPNKVLYGKINKAVNNQSFEKVVLKEIDV